MRSIKIKDLEIVEQERYQSIAQIRDTAKAISELAVSNAKKDIAIAQMAQMIARLNIELQKLKGDGQDV